jgi:putative colanic acid biosysnthesis UDP-glucose lipid carrier transferase
MLLGQGLNQFNLGVYDSRMPKILRAADGLIIASSLYFLSFLYNHSWPEFYTHGALFSVLFFFICSANTKLYESWRIIDFTRVIMRLWSTWGLTIFGLLILASATKKSEEYSRFVFYLWFIITPILLTIWRLLIDYNPKLYFKSKKKIRVVFAGWSPSIMDIITGIKNNKNIEFETMGIYDDHETKVIQYPGDITRHLGSFDRLIQDAQQGHFDLVYINLNIEAKPKIEKIAKALSDTTVSLYYLFPQNNFLNLLQPNWHYMSGHHAVSIFESPFAGPNVFIKRLEDIVIGSFIMLLIMVPLIILGIVIKLTSRGPIIFKQRRYGLDGKEFFMYKFRSMRVMEDGDKVTQATKDDKRFTPIGKFIRKYSLDELPQFLNVLKGDMSIVGPRPHAVSHNEEHRANIPGYMLRHKVKPGITGIAQINDLRGEVKTAEQIIERTKADLYYIGNWSLWMDIQIILISIFKGFISPNAY